MIEIDKQAERAKIEAELSAVPLETLCERLRGVVRIPVNDGAGPLNGSNEFVRQFETGPINHVAARTIERLMAERDGEREAHQKTYAALAEKDQAMGVVMDRAMAAGVDFSDLIP